MPVNTRVLRVFGPILILTGALGFVLPPRLALMSGEAPYNLFHVVFGIVGTMFACRGADRRCRLFNAGFGAIDLYQAAASALGWFPIAVFRWTRVDDAAHVVLGLALIGIGLFGAGSESRQ